MKKTSKSKEKLRDFVMLGGRAINYCVVHTAKKNIILKITDIDELTLSLPPFSRLSSRRATEEFILSHESDILKMLDKYRKNHEKKSADKNTVYVWGEPYSVNLICTVSKRETAAVDSSAKIITVQTKSPGDYETVKALIKKALLPLIKEACRLVNEKCCEDFRSCARLQTKPPLAVVTVRNMTSRWGSCTASKGRISIRFDLVQYPPECLESVFYHEYSHFAEQNHSAAFYDILEKMYPDYRKCSEVLKKKKYFYEML